MRSMSFARRAANSSGGNASVNTGGAERATWAAAVWAAMQKPTVTIEHRIMVKPLGWRFTYRIKSGSHALQFGYGSRMRVRGWGRVRGEGRRCPLPHLLLEPTL